VKALRAPSIFRRWAHVHSSHSDRRFGAVATGKTLCIDLRWIDSSGVGVYIKGIIPGIVERLNQVSIVGIGNRTRLEEFPWSRSGNVRLIDCRSARYSLGEQLRLPLAIPSNTNLFFSPYYTVPLLYRGPLAVTVHDMSHLLVEELIKDVRKRVYAQIMYKTLRKRASLIFTVSEFTKSELLRLTHGLREDNIVPTHLGVSPDWARASEFPRMQSRPYFVAVGNVKPYKNFGRLVEAFERIKGRIPHDLIIVGQTEGMITGESGEFFERVRGSGERVRLTGFVSEQELRSYVGHAEAMVMPSLYEGFGLPPLEAMAAGIPVVSSTAASLPEVCGEAAIYFEPTDVKDLANKLLSIASNSKMRTELRQKGLERSKIFTWKSCADRTADALESILDSTQE
jgi:glycosyltransferase involved in cell wall biosynthesis